MNAPGLKVHDLFVATYGTVMMRHSWKHRLCPQHWEEVSVRPRELGPHGAHAARMHVSFKEGMQQPARQCCGSVSPHRPCLLLDHGTPAVRQTVACYQLFMKSRSCVLLLRSFGLLVCCAFQLAGKSRRPARRLPNKCHGAARKNDSRGPCADRQEPIKHAAVHQPHS